MRKLFLAAILIACCMFSFNMRMTEAAERFDYMSEIDYAVSNVKLFHTIYKGMPITDFKANFENLEGWEFQDTGEGDGIGHSHGFRLTRQPDPLTPVYETIDVSSDGDNAVVGGRSVSFHITNESLGKMIFARMVDKLTRIYGTPDYISNGGQSIGANAK